jgi:hypothetical protein
MAHPSNEASSTFGVGFPSAVMAWLVMMAAGLPIGALVEFGLGHLDSTSIGEYAIAFLLAMPVPFALVIAVVYTPLVLGLRVVSSRTASPLAFGAACLVAAPFAGLVLIAIGSVVWGPPKIAGGFMTFAPTLVTIALGGLVFGLAFGRLDRRSQFSN